MFFKRQLPVIIMMTIGILTLFANFIEVKSVSGWVKDDSLLWFGIIAAFAIILGAFNLLKIHFSKVFRNKEDYPYSIILITGFILMIFAGFFFHGVDRLGNEEYDSGENFEDIGDKTWSQAEEFEDANENGKWDSAESFKDKNGNSKWDQGEVFTDIGNGKWGPGENFEDIGDKKWSQAEEFEDANENGKYDFKIEYIDISKNDIWDEGELLISDEYLMLRKDEDREFFGIAETSEYSESFIDINDNGKWDSAEEFEDLNGNNKWDQGEVFTDIGNGRWNEGEKFEDHDWGDHLFGVKDTLFSRLFNSIIDPLESTMFALLAFFVASASYRAFRIRNFEASLLLASGILVMIGAVPFGSYIPSWMFAYILLSLLFAFISPLFKDKKILWITFFVSFILSSISMVIWYPDFLNSKSILFWILAYPTRAGKTAIIMGVALGIAATSLRIIFGKDKSFLGD